MFCYMYVLMLHVSIHVCNIAYINRCVPPSVFTDDSLSNRQGGTSALRPQNSLRELKGRGCILRSDDTGFVAPSVIRNKSILYTSVYIDTEDCIITVLLNFSKLYNGHSYIRCYIAFIY